MTKNIIILLAGIGFGFLVMFFLKGCDNSAPTKKAQAIHDTITVVKEHIKVEKQEVVKWKQAKTEIHYTTHFDTIATIDTVIVELIKCDQIVKIDSNIIEAQDSVIANQDHLITLKDKEAKEEKKAMRKSKRKAFFRGVGVGALAVGAIIVYLIAK